MAAGSLDKIEVLKLLGMVNAVPEFTDQPKVINGCSDLLVAVLGERGRHALRRRARFAPERNDGRDRGRDAGRRVGNAYIRAKQRPSS